MVDANLLIMEGLFKVLRLSTTSKDPLPNKGNVIGSLKKLGLNSKHIRKCEGPLEKMLEHQWLEKWACTQNMSSSAILSLLNSSLTNRTFLVSNHITICDILWALSVKNAMENMTFADKEVNAHLTRWYNQVTHQMNIRTVAVKSKTLLYS